MEKILNYPPKRFLIYPLGNEKNVSANNFGSKRFSSLPFILLLVWRASWE